MDRFFRGLFGAAVAAAAVLLPLQASAYGSLVIFGDSLSDSGNNAIVLGTRPDQVITGNDYVPTFPYGSATYSNAAVWATTFAAMAGVSAQPSLGGGTNYAYGGAETGGRTRFPPSLLKQVDTYLAAPSSGSVDDTLFVIAGGANDARHAVSDIAGGASESRTISRTARSYAKNVGTMVDELQAAGARQIVVWDTPDIGKTPEAAAEGTTELSTDVAAALNAALERRLEGEAGVSIFSVYSLLDVVVANPAAYGLTNVTDACGATAGCNPASHLFWDAIHPTSGGHAILADAMFDAYGGASVNAFALALAPVPEPATVLLLAAGLALVGHQASARNSRRLRSASAS